jgi:hypothetical protein
VLVERCFQALDHDRIEFHDLTGRCAVASAGAAVVGIGLCVMAAPEIVVEAVIITGVVVVGFAIKEALDAHELKWADWAAAPGRSRHRADCGCAENDRGGISRILRGCDAAQRRRSRHGGCPRSNSQTTSARLRFRIAWDG